MSNPEQELVKLSMLIESIHKDIVWAKLEMDRKDAQIAGLKKALEYLVFNEAKNGSGKACTFCDMGGSGYSSLGDGHHDDTRHVCPVFVAEQALKEFGCEPEKKEGTQYDW